MVFHFRPASDFHVALSLIHLKNLGKATGSIDEAFYAIGWAPKLAGLLDPCDSNLTKTVREGCSRSIGLKVVACDILKELCILFVSQLCNLLDNCTYLTEF